MILQPDCVGQLGMIGREDLVRLQKAVILPNLASDVLNAFKTWP
jgi:hypothetical protein